MGIGHGDQAQVGSVGEAGTKVHEVVMLWARVADLDVEPSSVWSKTKGLAAGCLELTI